MNVIQVEVFGVLLTSIVLSLIFLSSEVFLAESGIRVDRDLAISCQNLAFLGQNEWVNFDEIAVLGHEAFVNFGEHVDHLVFLGVQTEV